MNLVEELLRRVVEDRRRIVIIGDAMVDRWVHGRVVTPCHDRCPKFVQELVVEVPGGASNAERSLTDWQVNTSLNCCSDSSRSVKCRYVDSSGTIVFRADDDKRPARDVHHWSMRLAREMLYHACAVLLSDYDKGFLTEEFIRDTVMLCRERGIPCVADCKREPRVYAGCILKCNSDYQAIYNQELARLVYDEGQRMVVTAGSVNPIIWDDGGGSLRLGPVGLGYDLPPVKCVNHVGAGDCFATHLTLALAYGFSLRDAAALAHSAGRVYVQHPHNRPPRLGEIAADLNSAT